MAVFLEMMDLTGPARCSRGQVAAKRGQCALKPHLRATMTCRNLFLSGGCPASKRVLSLDKTASSCPFYPNMFSRITALVIGLASTATAQKAVQPADFQSVLDDPGGDLSRLAKGILGQNGGNRLFYFPTHDEPATPATWGFNFENTCFKSGDGTELHGWFVPARGSRANRSCGPAACRVRPARPRPCSPGA